MPFGMTFCRAFLVAGLALVAACGKKPPPTPPPVKVTTTAVEQRAVTATQEWVGLLDGFQNASIQATC
jgi:predicted small lipoprotein YifL